MRWVNEDGSDRSGPWVEPVSRRSPRVDGCGSGGDRYVWAVPTQEGMALQLNSMLSVLTLGRRLGRLAVVMPLLAGGPHYRGEVAARRLEITTRMSLFVDLNATALGDARWVEFDDVYERLPRAAPCVSCAGAPPPHVRCATGWDYDWCDRAKVEARPRAPKCAIQRLAAKKDSCGACVFSVGFTPYIQRAEPAWRRMRMGLTFAEPYERAAHEAARRLFDSSPRFAALQMRRGDKSTYADRAGLTVDSVLVRTSKLAKEAGLEVVVATDDRSNLTLTKITRAGFRLVDSDLLKTLFPIDFPLTSIAAYIVDILLCVKAALFIGTSHKRMKSKQLELIKALRRGRWRAASTQLHASGQKPPREVVLT